MWLLTFIGLHLQVANAIAEIEVVTKMPLANISRLETSSIPLNSGIHTLMPADNDYS